jgi:predicted TIM-barrel fold metal-dependent hydrolase
MSRPLPPNTCDSHLHVFGDSSSYPASNPNALYNSPSDSGLARIQALHESLGIQRAVFVQPTIYGTDHSLLHDVLKADTQNRYRGVAIIDDTVSDAELARLDAVGVKGARFNFGGVFKLAPDKAQLRRSLARVKELGWYAKFFGMGDDLLAVEDELRQLDMPAMIDHFGGVDFSRGVNQPVVRLVLDLLKSERWWISVSNGDLRSAQGKPWHDAAEFGRVYVAAAPTRCVWGTDWPHVHRFTHPDPNAPTETIDHDYELQRADLTKLYVNSDEQWNRLMVHNPAAFFGFDTHTDANDNSAKVTR